MDYDHIEGQYSKMSRIELINAREDLAIKPNEYYKLGQDPMREKRLGVLTNLLLEK